MNLVVNARDAMQRGGRLVIETEQVHLDELYVMNRATQERLKPGDYVRLSISDTGVGMDAGIISRIFEPFLRLRRLGRGRASGWPRSTGS